MRGAAPRVAIIGGGLAGLAAAVALAEAGLRVELFEARRSLGGRAGSFQDPATGELVDHCQHVALGCCTNFLDLCRRTRLDALLRCDRVLHFLGPDGRRHDLRTPRGLPAPLHVAPALARLGYLSARERWGIAQAMRRLAGDRSGDDPHAPTIGQWLRRQRQSERAIDLFWAPVLVSALAETLDRASQFYARKFVVDALLSHRQGWEVYVPRVPLGELYGPQLAGWLAAHGVTVHLGRGIERVEGTPQGVVAVRAADGERCGVDCVVVAVPWRRCAELFESPLRAAVPQLDGLTNLQSSPITSVHLAFDREITDLPHAVLPGRTSQWLFRRSVGSVPRTESEGTAESEGALRAPYQVVISASRELAGRDREGVVAQVVRELAEVFPAAGQAPLLKSRVVTDHHAVFSPAPGIDRWRPPQRTAVPNLFLAGDWTATGWPATMESAVRSGYLAAEGVLAATGRPRRVLVPGLPRPGMARLLGGWS